MSALWTSGIAVVVTAAVTDEAIWERSSFGVEKLLGGKLAQPPEVLALRLVTARAVEAFPASSLRDRNVGEAVLAARQRVLSSIQAASLGGLPASFASAGHHLSLTWTPPRRTKAHTWRKLRNIPGRDGRPREAPRTQPPHL